MLDQVIMWTDNTFKLEQNTELFNLQYQSYAGTEVGNHKNMAAATNTMVLITKR